MEEEILAEFIARFGTTEDAIEAILFDEQRKVLQDDSTFVAALCTRRAGKSYLAAAKLFQSATLCRDSISLYIALTRHSARNILWPILLKVAERCGLVIDPIESKLTIKLPEYGSEIQLIGADTKNFIERLRGTPYPLAVIDEAGFFRDHIETLVDDVLTPAIADYNGQIILLGTPGVRPQGLFFDATQKPNMGYSVHKWSVFDNPHMPDARKFVDDYMKRKSWTIDNPTYRREWCGEWVEDIDALVYKFNKEKNFYKDLPKTNDWTNILAIDYGWHDKTAFAVVAYHPKIPQTYVRYAKGHTEIIPSQIAFQIQYLIRTYNPAKIVADTGGLGKSITEEMRIRYGIPVHAAKKTDKMAFISLLNGDLIDGNLLINQKLDELAHQYSTLIKDEMGNEDPGMPNDLCVSGGTYLLTQNGYKRMKDIVAGDYVLTHKKRFKKVLAKMLTGHTACYHLEFSNGLHLRCTGSHPILTTNGYVRCDSLTYANKCYVIDEWLNVSSLMGLNTDAIQTVNTRTIDGISLGLISFYTEKFGLFTMAQSLKGFKFITKTATRLTTMLTTLSALAWKNTSRYTEMNRSGVVNRKNQLHYWRQLGRLQPNGIGRKMVLSGTRTMLKIGSKKIELKPNISAWFAYVNTSLMTYLKKLFTIAQTSVELKLEEILASMTKLENAYSAQKTLELTDIRKQNSVAGLVTRKILTEKENVFNITVEDDHSYYANGVATSNCDAVLYAWRESKAHSFVPDIVYATPEDKINAEAEKLWDKDLEAIDKPEEWWAK